MEELFYMHPSEEELDSYVVGGLSLEHERLIEKHYLSCADRIERLSTLVEFITS